MIRSLIKPDIISYLIDIKEPAYFLWACCSSILVGILFMRLTRKMNAKFNREKNALRYIPAIMNAIVAIMLFSFTILLIVFLPALTIVIPAWLNRV